MINLNKDDKEIIYQNRNYAKELNLSCGSFFSKNVLGEVEAFSELLGKKLADIFNIRCPKIYVVKINDGFFVLSESLAKYEFKTAFEFGITSNKQKINSCSLVDVGCYIDALPNSLELMLSIIRIYIFDVMFYHDDRSLGNWGFLNSNNNLEVTIIDNENILNPCDKNVYGRLYASLKYKDFSIYDDFKSFLQEFGSLYLNMFAYYFEFITPSYFDELIEKIFDESIFSLEVKQTFKIIYNEHYQELKKIYEEFLGRSKNYARQISKN